MVVSQAELSRFFSNKSPIFPWFKPSDFAVGLKESGQAPLIYPWLCLCKSDADGEDHPNLSTEKHYYCAGMRGL
jgi:hypothetical protein